MNTDVQNYLQQAKQFRQNNDYNASLNILNQAYNVCAKNDYASLGKIYAFFGQIERDQQALNKALLMYNKALGEFRKISDNVKVTHTVRHIADLHQALGQHHIAEENYQMVLTSYRKSEETAGLDLANALRGFALLQEGLGNNTAAKNAWTEARAIYLSADIQAGVEECDGHLVKL
ncbi:hypothetical protein BKI52_35755 [marine bacterium AO1-C]|nr:hypothetical protein BKI52_35755 [marine bacterium AO1-C]